MAKKGVLPAQTLKELIRTGVLDDIDPAYVNPASVDLPLSDEAYRLETVSLPKLGEAARDAIQRMGGRPHDLSNPLEVGIDYAIKIRGTHHLLENVYGYINPKSTVGRINLLCRVIADGTKMYDALAPAGWQGEMWVLVRAGSFPVLLSPGQALSQLRLFSSKAFLDDLEANLAIREHGLLFDPDGKKIVGTEIRDRMHADSLLLTLKVAKGATGWECRGTSKVLDFSTYTYKPEEFFTKIEVRNGTFRAHKGSFYILTTLERVVVPPELSAELRPIDPRFGEFRSHSAGYIDPGWGWGVDGSACGRPITLEMTPFETADFYNGQPFARIRYEHMRERPEVLYDNPKSSYTMQAGARLSKHFVEA